MPMCVRGASARRPRCDHAAMVDRNGRIRVAIDGHVVGRRQTGNETYVVTLSRGLAASLDVDPTVYVDRGVRWPFVPVPPSRRPATPRRLLRSPFDGPIPATPWSTSLPHVQYVAPPLASVPVV